MRLEVLPGAAQMAVCCGVLDQGTQREGFKEQMPLGRQSHLEKRWQLEASAVKYPGSSASQLVPGASALVKGEERLPAVPALLPAVGH